MARRIIYIVSPRSAFSGNPGRKIMSMIETWNRKYEIETFFGGDILKGRNRGSGNGYGNADYYKRSYRKSKLLSPAVHTVSELKDMIHNLRSYLFLQKKYKDSGLELVWERSSRLHFAGLLFAKKHRLPYVLEWKDHLVDYRWSLFKPIALFFEAYKCSKADKIVVESNVLKKQLASLNVDAEKIIVAHNACDVKLFQRNTETGNKYREQNRIGQSSVLIGYLGSYAFYHDAECLVKAADIIARRNHNGNVKFLMVGNGKDYDKCRALAESCGILDDSLLMKQAVPKEDVPGILSAIDIAVLPGSTDIICPIKVLEYMAAETAVVIPDYECSREVVTDQVDGVLFMPHNANDLADKLEALSKDSSIVEEFGRQAKKIVAQKFSWEQTWGRTLDEIIKSELNENNSN